METPKEPMTVALLAQLATPSVIGMGAIVANPETPALLVDLANSEWQVVILENGAAGISCKANGDWMQIPDLRCLESLVGISGQAVHAAYLKRSENL
jgi:hypothetical protein